jgi:lysozyme
VKTSPTGIALIKSFESCKIVAYQDGAGVWTIGWGHTGGVKHGDTCTQAQADAWLAEDIGGAEDAVSRLVRSSLTQNQFDALVSFTYNEGSGHLAQSTLLELVNSLRMESAAAQFARWDMVAGKSSPGLLRRRDAEAALFAGAHGEQA